MGKKVCKLVALCLTGIFVLSACGQANPGGTQSQTEETKELTDKSFKPSEEYVKTLGRTSYVQDTLWMVLSGTGAEFTFTGTKATITMQVDSSLMGSKDSQARIAIFVNDQCVVDDMVDKLTESYTVFEAAEPTECVVKIVKLSEAPMSSVGIKMIDVTSCGDIKPTANKEHFIEFIGDSITCGYGVEDEEKEHHFSTKTENVMKTYAYKTAEALDVDYSMVCYSGHGIISGYTTNGEKVTEQTVPSYYSKLGYTYTTYLNQTAYDVEWDFSKRQPDLIVINLGTNDESYTGSDAAKREEYIAGYVAFLKQVRELNPNAKILCTLGTLGDGLYVSIQKAVKNYKSETGDTNIDTFKFDVQSATDGYAADWHPTEKTHTKAAEKLMAKIKELMGW
ncbi:MAG: GDSL-type esterase/lipase family protein [Agathobacter sp.]